MNTFRMTVILGLLALAGSAAAPRAPAQDDTPGPADSATASSRAVATYWGPIAFGSDSARGEFRTRPLRTWERVALVPYRVVFVPVYLTTRALKAGIVFADHHDILPSLGRAFPIRVGPVAAAPVGTVGGLPGLGGGVTIVGLKGVGPPEDWIRLRYVTTVNGTHRASAGFRVPLGRADVEAGGGYRLQRNARFYGIGPRSREADLSYYTQEQYWAGASYRLGIATAVTAEGSAHYTSIATRGPRDEDGPSVGIQFAPAAAPAGFGDRSQGATANLLLRLDTTSETGRPETGVVATGRAGYFTSVDAHRLSYWSFEAEAGGFVPLWFTERALALRGGIMWLDPDDGAIPFARLATNHSGEELRGYRDFRWRDRGLLDLSAEYRWPVWALDRLGGTGVDAYLFMNTGQVFGSGSEISTGLWRTSWGGGFRMISSRHLAVRLELARSAESSILRMRADQIFEFKRSGLYAGHIPISAPN